MKYPRLYCLILLLWAGSNLIEAQTAFSLLESSDTETTLTESANSEKYQRAKAIYDKLIEAKGDNRLPPPPFRLVADGNKIAFLEVDGRSIGLEEKGYDILDRFGDDGLAFILGHEISHYYEKHLYLFDVFETYEDDTLAKALKTAKEKMPARSDYNKLAASVETSRKRLTRVMAETEADYLGGFLAYSAGYDVQRGPEIFEALYDSTGYDMDDNLFGYQSKETRKDMAAQAREKMNEFIDVFTVANLLIAENRYADARVLYRYILQQYQGREIYNNLGVLTVLEALRYASNADKKLRLPLELDLSFNVGSRNVEDGKAKMKRLLEEALTYFKSAVSMDSDYAPAYLNMACAYYYLDDLERARFYAATEAIQSAETDPKDRFTKTMVDAKILLALVTLKEGDKAGAEEKLLALKDVSKLAAYNYGVVKTGSATLLSPPDNFEFFDLTVDGVSKADQLLTRTANPVLAKQLPIFGDATLDIWDEENSRIYLYSPGSNSTTPISFAITDIGYAEDSGDDRFKVGTPGKDIIEAMGDPLHQVETVGGQIWVYNDGFRLIVDPEKGLQRWIIKGGQ